jgi:hypothetical protein
MSNTRTQCVKLLSFGRSEHVYKSLRLLCYHRSLNLATTPILNHCHKPRQTQVTLPISGYELLCFCEVALTRGDGDGGGDSMRGRSGHGRRVQVERQLWRQGAKMNVPVPHFWARMWGLLDDFVAVGPQFFPGHPKIQFFLEFKDPQAPVPIVLQKDQVRFAVQAYISFPSNTQQCLLQCSTKLKKL